MKYINEYNDFEKNLFSQVDSKPEIFVASLIKDLEIKYHKDFPDSTLFIHKETGEVWMEDDKKSGKLYVSYNDIWLKVLLSFSHKRLNTSKLIKYVVETGFNKKVGTVSQLYKVRQRFWWKRKSRIFTPE